MRLVKGRIFLFLALPLFGASFVEASPLNNRLESEETMRESWATKLGHFTRVTISGKRTGKISSRETTRLSPPFLIVQRENMTGDEVHFEWVRCLVNTITKKCNAEGVVSGYVYDLTTSGWKTHRELRERFEGVRRFENGIASGERRKTERFREGKIEQIEKLDLKFDSATGREIILSQKTESTGKLKPQIKSNEDAEAALASSPIFRSYAPFHSSL